MTYRIIHAYVRPQVAARVVQALIDAGCDDLFLDESRRVAAGLQDPDVEYSVQISQRVEPMTRLEVIGPSDEVERWTRIIRESGSTRRHGDGVVAVVTAVEYFHLSGPTRGSGHARVEGMTEP